MRSRMAKPPGWIGVGVLLAKRRGHEHEAEAAFRQALDAGADARVTESAAGHMGDILSRRGDVAGARAAFELHGRSVAERLGVDGPPRCIATIARFRVAISRRPWSRRVHRSICVVIYRFGSILSGGWQRGRYEVRQLRRRGSG